MAGYPTRNSYDRKGKKGVPDSRVGRMIWLTVAVVFLALTAVVVWTWAHADAEPTHRPHRPDAGGMPSLDESVTLPAAFDRHAPSRRRATHPMVGAMPLWPAAESCAKGAVSTGAEATDGRGARGRDELIYHGRRNDRMEIALSFDDGPHPRYTPMILDILAEYGIHATFFMVGENVGYYPAAAEAVVAAGHEIGNHTFTHRGFNRMNEHDMLAEIAACEDAIYSVSEQKPHFIRPPEGSLNDTMRRVIGSLDYRIVLWDIDTRDWAHTPPDAICAHILDTVQAGDIILMHDFIGHDSPTPEALRLVIPALLARGYRFVTVGELVDDAIEAD